MHTILGKYLIFLLYRVWISFVNLMLLWFIICISFVFPHLVWFFLCVCVIIILSPLLGVQHQHCDTTLVGSLTFTTIFPYSFFGDSNSTFTYILHLFDHINLFLILCLTCNSFRAQCGCWWGSIPLQYHTTKVSYDPARTYSIRVTL